MSEFDPLTEQQAALLLWIDAGLPCDPVLRAIVANGSFRKRIA